MAGDTRYWHMSGFDRGPHADSAIVAAATLGEAVDALHAYLTGLDDDVRSELSIWEPSDIDGWRVVELAPPVLFVLGAGCR